MKFSLTCSLIVISALTLSVESLTPLTQHPLIHGQHKPFHQMHAQLMQHSNHDLRSLHQHLFESKSHLNQVHHRRVHDNNNNASITLTSCSTNQPLAPPAIAGQCLIQKGASGQYFCDATSNTVYWVAYPDTTCGGGNNPGLAYVNSIFSYQTNTCIEFENNYFQIDCSNPFLSPPLPYELPATDLITYQTCQSNTSQPMCANDPANPPASCLYTFTDPNHCFKNGILSMNFVCKGGYNGLSIFVEDNCNPNLLATAAFYQSECSEINGFTSVNCAVEEFNSSLTTGFAIYDSESNCQVNSSPDGILLLPNDCLRLDKEFPNKKVKLTCPQGANSWELNVSEYSLQDTQCQSSIGNETIPLYECTQSPTSQPQTWFCDSGDFYFGKQIQNKNARIRHE